MKKLIYVSVLLLAVVSLSGCTQESKTEVGGVEFNLESVPERRAEINGVVKSIVGNEMIVSNEVGGEILSDEEREAKKIANQKLTLEERQANREETKAEVETEVVILTVPVGVRVVKASGTGDGSIVDVDLAEVKAGEYVSAWLMDGEVEIVKIKGSN